MDIMMQWEMFLAGIAIMFFLGCFFTKNMRETHFEEILSKGAAIFFIAIFVFNYHLNLPVKEVYCWILLFAALGLPLCIYKIYNNGKKIDYCKKSIIVPFIVLGGGISSWADCTI